MGGLERRLEHLESARRREEALLSREALTYLSDEELHALEVIIEARIEALERDTKEGGSRWGA